MLPWLRMDNCWRMVFGRFARIKLGQVRCRSFSKRERVSIDL